MKSLAAFTGGHRARLLAGTVTRRLLSVCIALIGMACCKAVVRADFISGVSVTTNSERYGPFGQDRRALHLVDSSGWDSNTWSHTTTPDGYMWLSENGYPSGVSGTTVAQTWVKFDLGDAYDVSVMRVWNYNESNHTHRGVKDANIYVSTQDYADVGSWTDLGTFTLTQAPGSSVVDFSQELALNASGIRYVLIDPVSNWWTSAIGGQVPWIEHEFVGLSEVRFGVIPELTSLALFGLGLCGLMSKRPRRKRDLIQQRS